MKLFYKKSGAGKPFIILHGLFGSLDNWQSVGKQLSENFEVYLADQRNHGHSPHSETWNYKVMSDDLHELIMDNNLDKIILAGHSMGGKTAMQFASEHPEVIDKLIVIDIAPKAYPVLHSSVIEALQAVNLDVIQSRKEAEEILNAKIPDIATRQFLLKNLYWLDADAKKLAWRFNFEAIRKNIEMVGQKITIENFNKLTLFMRGEHSNYISKIDWVEIQQKFTAAELVTIPNAGHWIHADQPQAFLDTILDFCRK